MNSAIPQPLIILGTRGDAIDMLDTICDVNDVASKPVFECIGLLDDAESMWGTTVSGVPVLGPLSAAIDYPDAVFLSSIGSVKDYYRRESIQARTGLTPDRFATLVHPSASVSRMSSIGTGSVVLRNSTVSSGAHIGNHVKVLANALVSHDVSVGDFAILTGGVAISGVVALGRSCYIGSNSTVDSFLTVGDYALVGMGSVVLKDVAARTVVVGNPARFLRAIQDDIPAGIFQ